MELIVNSLTVCFHRVANEELKIVFQHCRKMVNFATAKPKRAFSK